MSVVFMSWFAAHLAERIGVRFGLNTLPVLLREAAAVLYWSAMEADCASDLRAYGVVHFYPVVPIPLLLALFPPRHTRSCGGRDHELQVWRDRYQALLPGDGRDGAARPAAAHARRGDRPGRKRLRPQGGIH